MPWWSSLYPFRSKLQSSPRNRFPLRGPKLRSASWRPSPLPQDVVLLSIKDEYSLRYNGYIYIYYIINMISFFHDILWYDMILYYTISNHTILYIYIYILYIISYHIISYHIISYYIILYHTISYYIILNHIISYHIISY